MSFDLAKRSGSVLWCRLNPLEEMYAGLQLKCTGMLLPRYGGIVYGDA